MAEIERQASATWGMGHAIAASDFMRIEIPGAPVQSRFKEPSMISESLENAQEEQHEHRHAFRGAGHVHPRNVLKRRRS